MPTPHDRVSIVLDDDVVAALEDAAAEADAAESRRRAAATEAVAWARAGFPGLDVDVLAG